ncbi:MAG: DUF2782 domain-containing protein [Gammaproteobacteria bacterium]|nr:DUF2782 domain-containing protein [Gammaproteobacteria bacterium]
MKPVLTLFSALLLLPGAAWADSGVDERPPDAGEGALEPEVTIIQQEQSTIQEYRSGGVVYMIRIDPKVGPPYYLIDTDHDGSLETRRSVRDTPRTVQWVLFRW